MTKELKSIPLSSKSPYFSQFLERLLTIFSPENVFEQVQRHLFQLLRFRNLFLAGFAHVALHFEASQSERGWDGVLGVLEHTRRQFLVDAEACHMHA